MYVVWLRFELSHVSVYISHKHFVIGKSRFHFLPIVNMVIDVYQCSPCVYNAAEFGNDRRQVQAKLS